MTKETALGAALKTAVQTKFDVFKRFKPLALGIDQDLIAAMPQYDSALIMRVLANHCRRPRYLKALARGGKRFDLNNRFKGEVTPEEQAVAAQNPMVKEMLEKQAARRAEAEAAKEEGGETQSAEAVEGAAQEAAPDTSAE